MLEPPNSFNITSIDLLTTSTVAAFFELHIGTHGLRQFGAHEATVNAYQDQVWTVRHAARQKYTSRTKNYGQVAEIILIAVNFI